MTISGTNMKAKKCDCCGKCINGGVIVTDGEENFTYAMSCASYVTGVPVNVINSNIRKELGLKDRAINIWSR
jgi:hypothetical protein